VKSFGSARQWLDAVVTRGSHRQFKHPTNLATTCEGTLASVRRQAGLEEKDRERLRYLVRINKIPTAIGAPRFLIVRDASPPQDDRLNLRRIQVAFNSISANARLTGSSSAPRREL